MDRRGKKRRRAEAQESRLEYGSEDVESPLEHEVLVEGPGRASSCVAAVDEVHVERRSRDTQWDDAMLEALQDERFVSSTARLNEDYRASRV